MAQRDNPMFFKEVLLQPKKKYTLQTITREIQQQTGISFSYNAAHIDPDTKVRLKTDRITVEQLLASIRKKTGIGYKVISKTHIIYTEGGIAKRKKAKKGKFKAAPRATYVQHQATETILRPIASGDSVTGQQIVIIGDSSVAAYYFSGGASAGGGYAGNAMAKYPVLRDVTDEEDYEEDEPISNASRNTNKGYTDTKREVLNYLKRSTLIGIGIAADESYYLNPTARVGFDFLYGTVSYNYGSYAHWRFGVGSSVKVNERMNLHLNITTGQGFSEKYNIQHFDTIPPIDSIQDPQIIETNAPLLVQSQLTRFTLSAEWDLGRGFTLGGGLILNRLKTSYSSYGNPVSLSNMLPIGYDADEKYRTLNPPYLLGNSYSGNTTSNVKTWIGLQLSLIYRFPFFD